MAKNTANMNAGTDNPSLARVDIRDMFNALGYDDAGAATSGTVYALAEKLNYNLATSLATLSGALEVNTNSAEGLKVTGTGGDVFTVDTANKKCATAGDDNFWKSYGSWNGSNNIRLCNSGKMGNSWGRRCCETEF